MTLATTKLKDRKAGDGVTSVFNFSDIPVLDKTWVKCQRLDATTGEVIETYTQGAGANQFQVTLASDYSGFTVTLGATATAALTVDYDLFAYRETPVLQETSFPYDNNIPPKTLERLFDRMIMAIQESSDKASLSVRAPISFTGTADLQLPEPSAGRVIGVWNDDGDALVEGPLAVDIANAQEYAEQAETAAAAAAAAAALGLKGFGAMTNIASASTVNLGSVTSNFANITGTTTISSFGTSASVNSPLYFVRFDGALTLTHSSTLQLTNAANITTAAGDYSLWQYLGSGSGWRLVEYFRATLVKPNETGTLVTTARVASETVQGLVELATAAEARAGTDTGRGITPATMQDAKMVYATTVAATSGTSIDFTAIPSWARRVTVFLNQVSKSGTSQITIRLGTGGTPAATGYEAGAVDFAVAAQGGAASTTGFPLNSSISATTTYSGQFTIEKSATAANTWVCFGSFNGAATAQIGMTNGIITLGGVLDMVRVTMENGTDTFDAGSVTVRWE